MTASPRARGITAVVAIVGALALTVPAGAAEVGNGSFETGDFTDWTVQQNAGSAGDWFVYSGATSPTNGFDVEAPPCETYAAITDQSSPSSQVLYQDLELEADQTHTLAMQLYYADRSDEEVMEQEEYPAGEVAADEFVNPVPDSLDQDGGFENQQYRVEIIDPGADPFTVDPEDIWLEIFRTEPGDPATMSWTTFGDIDLSAWAGETVRLRFAEVDNLGYFNAGVDCVEVTSTPIPTTTTTSTTTTTAPTTTAPPAPVAPIAELQPAFTG